MYRMSNFKERIYRIETSYAFRRFVLRNIPVTINSLLIRPSKYINFSNCNHMFIVCPPSINVHTKQDQMVKMYVSM